MEEPQRQGRPDRGARLVRAVVRALEVAAGQVVAYLLRQWFG